jgi:DNA-binding NarL/FixJ family response regulator
VSPQDHKPTVILADDYHGIVVRVQELLMESFDVVATAENGLKAVENAVALQPDVAVLDIAMPGLSGIDAAHQIKKLGLPTKLVFLTAQQDADYASAARALGASLVLKSRMHVDLIFAIKETLAGSIFLSPVPVMASPSFD